MAAITTSTFVNNGNGNFSFSKGFFAVPPSPGAYTIEVKIKFFNTPPPPGLPYNSEKIVYANVTTIR
jgi:hypothetical protein